ncbi:MAG: efflux RND transporter periplasmic adaptor subunit [Chelatococcus sp.]|jgi:membrane fusion protein (multidrug efflux system)|uniref:efflux RND transporter periplasmic adaptor subunit n=1 Tax=unclassified Chelatococcus TaxID=2638111 RepID=UPI001BD14E0A|nr:MULTISPECIES: efflux RND transporter periplasmic adaptor subunit [unclassified Chelatococcus]CAH1659185.1 Membrane fusion protein (Multidrug efflux system) [Hyphomicrobiales bacterium]MBS7740908.1 efflux RND transporter periplasmic adaptor subunit [Chelatococcus sp. HY11]MBX3537187.1 efflux RND transporter periplasmic adaptor subunit [Chelatococcus sp.]MBX3546801.1 efflux RND transporter periplasmic adaptor subunit [Chelatococcus sp.]MCO5077726.1 efflux RND transporter periplasmic adaptor s
MRKSVLAVVGLVALASAGAFMLDRGGSDLSAEVKRLKEAVFGEARARDQSAGPARQQAAAMPVEAVRPRRGEATSDILAVGGLQSDESVVVSSEIAGRVAEILFKEGQQVNAGAVLVKLDGSLTQAELDDAQARLDLADSNYKRTNALAKGGNATQRANDEAFAGLATARATLSLMQARFDKLSIQAPFPGVLGIRKVSVGAYLSPGAAIVNLEKIDALKVDFKVPEIFLSRVSVGQTVELTVDALPGRIFTGTIYAIDPMVDVNGRALTIRARLPNTDLTLRPGLFARITVKGQSVQNVSLVPEEAVVPRGKDSLIYQIVDGKAVETKVRLGNRKAGEVEILEGLIADAPVVTSGQSRLRDGVRVEVVASSLRQT